jgi:hypothetical protein
MNCMMLSFRQSLRRSLAAALLVPLAAACSKDHDSTANAQGVGDTIGAVRRLTVIETPKGTYRTAAIANPGSVTGTTEFGGVPESDTLIVIAADQNGCGKPLTIKRLERKGNNVTGVVIWLTDIREGRTLPLARRYELDNDNCAWDPVVQTAVAGGTLNVSNSDPLVERAFATDVSTGDTVAVAPFTDDGQLVPYDEMLRKSGVYEFSVESRPMSRAWVAVFDHPYFAISDANGAFTIEGVPPGTHQVHAWHPMLGLAKGTVTVTAGQPARLVLRW